MLSFRFMSAFAAATLLSMVSAQTGTTNAPASVVTILEPEQTVPVRTLEDVGCFNTSTPLEDHGEYNARSRGNCQLVCAWLKKPVMAMSEGTHCWCGDLIPDKNSRVPITECNTPCGGINTEDCGGPGMFMVVLTHTTENQIKNYVPPVVVSSSSSSIVAPVQQTTKAATTVQSATPTTTPSSASSTDKGPNKVSIAIGVVVGVLVLLGVIAGVFFFLRHKRRREVEEEFRRQANINSFTAGGKLHTSNSSMTDSRLDPQFMNRRASNGSIADNEDYSRRILKVTNA